MQGMVSGMGGVALVTVSDGDSGISGEGRSKVKEPQIIRRTSISEHHGHSFFHRPLATTIPT